MRIDEIVACELSRELTQKSGNGRVDGSNKDARKDFYSSPQWCNSRGRYEALKRAGGKCECCGASGKNVKLCVDHIRPVRKYWELRFAEENMQVLCDGCNLGKGKLG